MRPEDQQRFDEQEEYADGSQAEDSLTAKLGTSIPSLDKLRDDVENDLDANVLGIGWWQPTPDVQRRVAISDHLVQSLESIQTNLDEAALHHLEYEGWCEQIERKLARMISQNGTFEYPKQTSASDLLPFRHQAIHLAGFFRAVGSSLDCLAAAIQGVGAIPLTIWKADFSTLRSWLRGDIKKKSALRHALHDRIAQELENKLGQAGPAGWADWVNGYRNMLVHRARRIQLNVVKPSTHVFDHRGEPVPKTTPFLLLAADPDRSDIEALVENPVPVLQEDSRLTLQSCLGSLRFLVREITATLVSIWNERRNSPGLLPQPESQWPLLRLKSASPFRGYAPNTMNVSVTTMMTSPRGPMRLRAAGLSAERKPEVWPAET